MSHEVPLDEPWKCPNARDYDSKTVYTFLNERMWTNLAKQVLIIALESIMSADLGEISLLYFLFAVHDNGGIDEMLNGLGGAQDSKLIGGCGVLPITLMNIIGKDKIKLKSPVQHIDQSQKDYIVVTCKSSEQQYRCKCLILAISPTLCSRISYAPKMP
ncbi:unnamed protein product, partial [Didymodactylos carnosus]